MNKEVIVYTTKTCPYCARAKSLLESRGVTYQEIPVDGNAELRQAMAEKAGRTSVPQIWVGEIHVGGCDDLYAADANGELGRLMESA